MALIDASAASTMQLASELMEARDTITRQRRTIWALVAALRSERVASSALVDVLDSVLTDDG